MKKTIALVLSLVLLVSSMGSFANTTDNIQQSTLSVSGEATVKMSPNVGYVSIGVRTENKESKIAQSTNKEIMNKVYKQLLSLKIDSKDIKTLSYNIYPLYNNDPKTGKSYISGYQVDNVLRITVKNIDLMGNVIDVATENGANNISDISFDILDKEEAYLKALELSVQNSQTKAERLAKVLKKTTTIQSIVENSVYYDVRPVMYKNLENYASDSGSTPVLSGEVMVKASVQTIYIIK